MTLLVMLGAFPAMAGATIEILDQDPEGVGFKDRTPVEPVGGNPGRTLGEQRLNVFKEAARIWGQALDSNVVIKVAARFDELPCDSQGVVLGAAGPSGFSNSTQLPRSKTWYPTVLVNRLFGARRTEGSDLTSTFNANLDRGDLVECGAGQNGWYYGLDFSPSGTRTDLLGVVLHEFGHGLGFLSTFGQNQFTLPGGLLDVWSDFLIDGATDRTWRQLDPDEREASALSGRLAWNGKAVTALAPSLLRADDVVVKVTSAEGAPAAVGLYPAVSAQFSAPISASFTPTRVTGAPPTNRQGCEKLPPLDGDVLLVARGTCPFVTKARNALDAGASAVIVTNNATGTFGIGGQIPGFPLPVVGITSSDGERLWAAVDAGLTLGGITRDQSGTRLSGVDEKGRVLMYAPSTYDPGSSISHWTIATAPDLLMEPFASPGDGGLDLTTALMRDIGWFLTDIAVKVTPPAEVRPDAEATFTIEVENTAPSPATSVTVSASAPASLTPVRNAGACTTPFPCTVAALAPGAKATITSTYRVGAGNADAGVTITVAAADNYNSFNDSAEVKLVPAGGCGCGAADLGLGTSALLVLLLRRRRSSSDPKR